MSSENELVTIEKLSGEQLEAFVRDLVDNDFSRLVQILYRFDVSEEKIRQALAAGAPADAGTLIAGLLLERIAQSRKTREQFRRNEDIPEQDSW